MTPNNTRKIPNLILRDRSDNLKILVGHRQSRCFWKRRVPENPRHPPYEFFKQTWAWDQYLQENINWKSGNCNSRDLNNWNSCHSPLKESQPIASGPIFVGSLRNSKGLAPLLIQILFQPLCHIRSSRSTASVACCCVWWGWGLSLQFELKRAWLKFLAATAFPAFAPV